MNASQPDTVPDTPLDDLFETLFRLRPVDASFVGRHEYDGVLPGFQPDDVAHQLTEIDRLIARFEKMKCNDLVGADRIDCEVGLGYLRSQAALWRSDHAPHRDPAPLLSLAVLGVIGLLRRDHAPAADRVARAVQRISAFPQLLSAVEDAARRAPELWLDSARPLVQAGLALLRKGVLAFCEEHGLPSPDDAILAEGIMGFQRVADILQAPVTGPRGPVACGADLMNLLLRETHHLPGADFVVALAEVELQSSRDALTEAARPLGLEWQEVLAALQADRVPAGEVLARHREIFEAHKALVQEKRILTWPDYPLEYRPVPGWLRGIMGDAMVYPYHAAAPLDPDVAVDFLVPDAPDGTSELTILSNHVLHHAGVGHHVQNWFAYTLASTRFGRVSAVDSAGYIFIHSGIGLAEGWSGYVPGMIAEFGMFDKFQSLGPLHDRLRAACRGMMDVRLHCGDWGVEECVRFLVDASGAEEGAALAAVRRISQSPSSGSMYLVGPAMVRALREAVAGPDASPKDIGEFHDRLLAYGSLPMPIIAREMTGLSVAELLKVESV